MQLEKEVQGRPNVETARDGQPFALLQECAALVSGRLAGLDWRVVLDAFADAVVATDGTGQILYVNDAIESLLGWSSSELVGQPLITIVPPRLRDVHRAGFNQYVTTHVPKLIGRPVRVPTLHRDGHEIVVELSLAAFRIREHEDLIVGSMRDLRERVELERQITVTRFLRATTEAAGRLSSDLDLEHVLHSVVETLVQELDAAAARIWLYDADKRNLQLRASAGLTNDGTFRVASGVDVATSTFEVAEVARTGKSLVTNGLTGEPKFDQDWVASEKIATVAGFPLLIAGELHGVLMHYSRRPLDEELVEALGAFVTVVTASLADVYQFAREQAARAEAEAAQHRLAFLVEASSALAASLDYETTLQNVAHLAVPRLADWCVVDLLQVDGTLRRLAAAPLNPDRAELAHELHRRYPPQAGGPGAIAAVLSTGEPVVYTEVTDAWLGSLARDAEHLRMLREIGLESVMCVPLFARGRTQGVISFAFAGSGRRYGPEELSLAQDMASRGSAAIENARLFHEAQEANRAKDSFLAVLSHELRTPLTAIQAGIELLRRSPGDAKRVQQIANLIERNVGLQTNLMGDLLDLSRITRGKVSLEPRSVALGELVRDALEGLRSEAAAAGLKLDWEPPLSEVYIEVDPYRIQQVLLNLVGNAIRYTPPGGRVRLTLRQAGGLARLVVADTGIGISPEALPLIFEMFHQVEGSTARRGLGVGLALVRALVRLHGGRVWAESGGLGQGSQFIVELPAIGAPGISAPADAPEAARPSPTPAILLVEDNSDSREMLAEVLALSGYEVRAAASVEEALSQLVTWRPDVILADIGLPGLDGYELIRRVRLRPELAGVVALAVTGYGTSEDREKALAAGFDGHWTKPIDLDALDRRLRQIGAIDSDT